MNLRRTSTAVLALAAVAAAPAAAQAKTTKNVKPLRVLVSNDDGVRAPGIDALVKALRKLPKVTVTVVAPAANQSGTGGKTTPGALTATRTTTKSGYPAIAVKGFPADSVNYALQQGRQEVPGRPRHRRHQRGREPRPVRRPLRHRRRGARGRGPRRRGARDLRGHAGDHELRRRRQADDRLGHGQPDQVEGLDRPEPQHPAVLGRPRPRHDARDEHRPDAREHQRLRDRRLHAERPPRPGTRSRPSSPASRR